MADEFDEATEALSRARNQEVIQSTRKAREQIESLNRTSAIGSLSSALTGAWYGINHRRIPQALPRYKDSNNLVFVTRPRLNLSDGNIRVNRILARLENGIENSVPNAIRCLLDPTLQTGSRNYSSRNPQPIIKCALVDPKQPFIPLITNTLESLSGFPNLTAFTYTTPEGMYKESQSQVDGPSKYRSTYDIQLSFRNVVGDPLTTLFEIWGHYMASVFDGSMVPYPEFISRFERDYDSRIFSLNVDPTMTYVTRIGSTIAFPLDAPNGVALNFERDRVFTSANDTISISMRAHGYETNDPILVEEFNHCVEASVGDQFKIEVRNRNYSQIPRFLLNYFNNIGYPYIDPRTYELQWWIDNRTFDIIAEDILSENRYGENTKSAISLDAIEQNMRLINDNLRNPV